MIRKLYLWLVLAVLTLVTAAPASASTAPGAETRTGVFDLVSGLCVGLQAPGGRDFIGGNGAWGYDLASRSTLAARGGIPTGVCFTAGTLVQTADGEAPIERLHVGDRVTTVGHDSASAVNPETWREIKLRMPNPDGSDDVLELDTLRPVSWIEETGSAPGRWISFGLPEMGLYGPALVDSIGPLPSIKEGAGRVVLSTVTHLNGEVLQVRLAGNDNPLEPTATHRLYSVDRGDWAPAKELHAGEKLATADGFVTVEGITTKPWVERVYNIEVETEHSYLVGDARVLSHNVNPCAAVADEGFTTLYHGTTRSSAWRIMKEGFVAGADDAVFFAEEMETAGVFGRQAARFRGATSGTILELRVPNSFVRSMTRDVVGRFRGAPRMDLGSGFERILFGESLPSFNAALRSGAIGIRPIALGL